MYRFILKRLLMLIPVLLGVSFIVYTILSFTPGDPVQMMLGDNYSEESYAAMQEELGLDDPFLVQYGRFIINAVHGDFGTSYSTGRQYFRAAWWVCAFPGFAIMLTILSLNLLGDGLRDALDPKLKN